MLHFLQILKIKAVNSHENAPVYVGKVDATLYVISAHITSENVIYGVSKMFL